MKKLLFFVLFLAVEISKVYCAPYSQGMRLQQPDGISFLAIEINDEYGTILYSKENNEIVKNKNDDFYYYAKIDDSGNLTPTDFKVGYGYTIISDTLKTIKDENVKSLYKHI